MKKKQKIANINKNKSWVFEKITLTNRQQDSSREKWKKTQINKTRNEKEVTKDNTERLEISSRKLEIPREHFMQRWA